VAGTQHHVAICLANPGAGRGQTWGSRPLLGWLRAALAAPARTSSQAALPGLREPAPRPWLPANQRAVSQARPGRSGLLLLSLRSAPTSADPANPAPGAAHCDAAPGTGRSCTAGACAAVSGPGAPCSASLGAGARASRACAGSGAAIRTGGLADTGLADRCAGPVAGAAAFKSRDLNLSRSRARQLGSIGCALEGSEPTAAFRPGHAPGSRTAALSKSTGGQMKAKMQAASEVTRCGKHRRSMLTNVLLHRADVGEASP